MRMTRVSTVALALAGTFGLAGCGSDGNVTDPSASPQTAVLTGRITSNTTLNAQTQYLLRGGVFVESGATLTIEPGTVIAGEKSSTGTLVIARGGRINAVGAPDRPIVFTTDQAPGRRARGDWGGLILNGNAPINVPGGTAQGEGDTGVYGGNNPTDSSGALRYVRVEYGGIEFSPDNELNGIAFQGVGAGTACDHLQVHYNLDDGFEWFGGTVACKYLLATGAGDDSFDWTEGWTGRGQFWISQARGDDADRGIEADNSAENNVLQPVSFPTIFNITLVGAPTTADGAQTTQGMLLREGTAGRIRNFIVTGFKREGIALDHAATIANANSGALSLENGIVAGNLGGTFDADANGVSSRWANISTADPQMPGPYNLTSPNFQPPATSPARSGAVPVLAPPSDGFFEAVTFIGAMGGTDWTTGWTTRAQN